MAEPLALSADGTRSVRATATPAASGQALAAMLRRARYEVLPVARAADDVEQHLSTEITVTVTASPRRGLEPTLALTEELARRGYRAVPHLAARLVIDGAELAEILHRLESAGVVDVFVIAGDSEHPVGDFANAQDLLVALHRLRESGLARGIEQLGIAGYPEGHPLVSDDELARALRAKRPLATYLVSQLCFDPAAISDWIVRTGELGVSLPIQVGIPGVVDRARLLQVAGRIGVGQSTRFLRKHRGSMLRLVQPGHYRPDDLVRRLTGMSGLHVYTLGNIAGTERWRRRLLAEVTGSEQDGAAS